MNLYSEFAKVLSCTNKIIIETPVNNYSFQDIEQQVLNIASVLQELNVKPGDRVAVQVEKSEYNLFLYLACLYLGIIYLPLNTTYTLEELNYFFSDAKPTLVVCDSSKLDAITALVVDADCTIKTLDVSGKGTLLNTQKNKQAIPPSLYLAQPDDIAVILYTSGTTGKPKGAMITHQNLYTNAMALVQEWGVSNQDTILHMLPLFHVHGLFFGFHTAMLTGASIQLLPKFDIDLFFYSLSHATVFMGVPTYYMRLLSDKRLSQDTCRHMRLFISGSAPLLPTTFSAFKNKTGQAILERYGMTETGINTSNPLAGERKVGTVGTPLPGINVRVVDEKNQILSIGIVGNIQIKGNNLFKGYWMNPQKTKADFTEDGYFKTGDQGFFDDDGYLSIVGRSKDMIISGGLNVYPKEIETTIDSIEGVTESAIIGVPHADFGEAVVAIVVKSPTAQLNEHDILVRLKQSHAAYKCPKRIVFVEHLPKNTMGKVQKNILREQFSI